MSDPVTARAELVEASKELWAQLNHWLEVDGSTHTQAGIRAADYRLAGVAATYLPAVLRFVDSALANPAARRALGDDGLEVVHEPDCTAFFHHTTADGFCTSCGRTWKSWHRPAPTGEETP